MNRMRHGPALNPSGGTIFRLWAPAAKAVDLVIDRRLPMQPVPGGWFELEVADARPGTRYKFRIDGDIEVPDPASLYQPDDVHGASEVIDHTYRWQAEHWHGRPWHEAVVLEIHVGTFSTAGTFRGAIPHLDDVVKAGFTAIELMPVAEFAGRRNWGYDGVLLYAPDSAYGRPDDLRELVDAAHQRGLMVFLDVVYNHFGPEGNYLERYAPQFFTNDAETPWGRAIDYAVPEVRAFAVENALHWLDHYRFDGLRLDAVHAIAKRGQPSILEELSAAVGDLAARSERLIHLVLENDDNSTQLLDPKGEPPAGKYRAQWNDDYHHAWHVLLSGETGGYYCDYAERPREQIARILASGFAYQGEASAHRKGARRGEPSGQLPPTAFVSFLQNHDQIGNRARGERLELLAKPDAVEAALAVTLLAPMPPMMFMGEEWGTLRPFPFFCDFTGELANAVRTGRKREFADAYRHEDRDGEVPDPLSEETFRAAVLDWDERAQPRHRTRLELVTTLLRTRAQHVTALLAPNAPASADARVDGDVLIAPWAFPAGTLALMANLSDVEADNAGNLKGTAIWGGASPPQLPAWSVYWTLGPR